MIVCGIQWRKGGLNRRQDDTWSRDDLNNYNWNSKGLATFMVVSLEKIKRISMYENTKKV